MSPATGRIVSVATLLVIASVAGIVFVLIFRCPVTIG
jgi:hypothetical protein